MIYTNEQINVFVDNFKDNLINEQNSDARESSLTSIDDIYVLSGASTEDYEVIINVDTNSPLFKMTMGTQKILKK